MRVIAGTAKGRRLYAPKGMETRPITAKIKEALFNIWQERIPGADFLDFFAPDAPKMEMIVTFMALLDMLARGEIHLRQSRPYAPILVLRGDLCEDDQAFTYMDEE